MRPSPVNTAPGFCIGFCKKRKILLSPAAVQKRCEFGRRTRANAGRGRKAARTQQVGDREHCRRAQVRARHGLPGRGTRFRVRRPRSPGRPQNTTARVAQRKAKSISCVEMTSVRPSADRRASTVSSRSSPAGSSEAAGSSNRMISLSMARISAMVTRFFSPPDSSCGGRARKGLRSIYASA